MRFDITGSFTNCNRLKLQVATGSRSAGLTGTPEGFSQFGEDLNVGLRKQLAGHIGAIAMKQEVIEGDRYARNPHEVFQRPHVAIYEATVPSRYLKSLIKFYPTCLSSSKILLRP